jgi:hypothetical protein
MDKTARFLEGGDGMAGWSAINAGSYNCIDKSSIGTYVALQHLRPAKIFLGSCSVHGGPKIIVMATTVTAIKIGAIRFLLSN